MAGSAESRRMDRRTAIAGSGLALVGLAALGVLVALLSGRTPTLAIPVLADILPAEATHADPANPMGSWGTVRVERFWTESDCTYALVDYRNDTTRTFLSAVIISATTYSVRGSILDTNARCLLADETGPIAPGFERTLKIPIPSTSRRPRSVKAVIEKAW